MAVYAAVRNQAHQVQRSPRRCRGPDRVHQRGIFVETPFFDRVVDAHQVLLHDHAAADGHMSDFRVSHLARGQTDAAPGSFQRGQRIFGEIAIEIGCIGNRDGVMRGIRVHAEPVENNQQRRATQRPGISGH